MVKINRKLLLAKGHYFLAYGAMGGVMPFFMTMAQQFGASPAIIGIIYSTLPLFPLISKPLIGGLADKFQQKKLLFLISLLIMFCAALASYFIPLPDSIKENTRTTTVTCHGLDLTFPCLASHALPLESPLMCNFSCPVANEGLKYVCKKLRLLCPSMDLNFNNFNFSDTEPYLSEYQSTVLWTNVTPASNVKDICRVQPLNPPWNNEHSILETTTGCAMKTLIQCEISCENQMPDLLNSTYSTVNKEDDYDIFRVTLQVGLLWSCMSFVWLGISSTSTIGDNIIIGLLKDSSQFGRQRLWGSVGWGCFSVVAGLLVDLASKGKSYRDFSLIYCIVLVCAIFDVILVLCMTVENSEKPKSLWKNVGSLLAKPRVVIFTIAVFLVGWFHALFSTFLVVYLNELHATQLLVGLVFGAQAVLGEIPFFFFSSWILKRIGYANAMVVVLAVAGLRLLAYSLITNPWTVIPVEICQGVTFGLFYATLTTYPNQLAPPNLRATLQGSLQATFEGLGIGVGSIVNGLVYQQLGGRMLFTVNCITSFSFAVIIGILLYIIHRKSTVHHGSHQLNKGEKDDMPHEEEMVPIHSTN